MIMEFIYRVRIRLGFLAFVIFFPSKNGKSPCDICLELAATAHVYYKQIAGILEATRIV